jgi:hypothetical protein
MIIEKWIPESRLADLKKKFESMSRKSIALNVAPPKINFTSEFMSIDVLDGSKKYSHSIAYNKVIFEGEPPRKKDWNFLALIEHGVVNGKYVNIVKAPSFQDEKSEIALLKIMPHLAACKPNCTHCNTSRERSKTFIAQNLSTGEVQQVGSTCIDDFIGKDSLLEILDGFNYKSAIDGLSGPDDEHGFISSSLLNQKSVLLAMAVSCEITERNGFTSVKNETDITPSNRSRMQYSFKRLDSPAHKEIAQSIVDGTQNQYIEKAKVIIDKILFQKQDTSFIINAISICKRGVIDVHDSYTAGILSALPNWHIREEEKLLGKGPMANEHFGTKGERGYLKLRVTGIYKNAEAKFPYTSFKMKDDDGRSFAWDSSLSSGIELIIGQTYLMKATIKAFMEPKGVKTTSLSRCSEIEAAEASQEKPSFASIKQAVKKYNKESDGMSMKN